jgi:hypothetical protein
MDIVKEVAVLHRMNVPQLKARYEEVFGDPTRSGHKDFLVRKIAWRLQSQAEGDLSERARRRAQELASDLYLRSRAPSAPAPASGETVTATMAGAKDDRLPMAGQVLTREYKGRTIQVTVLTNGFNYEGQRFRSLSAVAKVVTGTHWNGYHFFGLAKDRRDA